LVPKWEKKNSHKGDQEGWSKRPRGEFWAPTSRRGTGEKHEEEQNAEEPSSSGRVFGDMTAEKRSGGKVETTRPGSGKA